MLTIRQASPADSSLIHTLASKVFPDTYRTIISPQQIDYMMEWMYAPHNLHKQMTQEGHLYFLAYWDNEPCGYVSVHPDGPNCFHLQKIYVLPSFQGRHIGESLFQHILKYIRQIHPAPCSMELNVNRRNPALGFYRKQGMRKVGEGDFEIGNGYYMNDYIMRLELELE